MITFDDIDFHLFIESLTRTIELKDMYTAGHSRRVSEIAEHFCRAWGRSERECEYLHVIGHVHDIGKIGIADGILMKSGSLLPAEHLLMQQHTVIGASIFENLPGLGRMADIIRHHHERFDGKGYPDGLKGEAIPLESTIVALADSYDAMTTYRPYKAALTEEQAFEEIRRNRGTQFHPDLCDLFLDLLERHPRSKPNLEPSSTTSSP
jgi:HD-GYP domain-containing protein (c-di-GMP phosphodiesterase class II)